MSNLYISKTAKANTAHASVVVLIKKIYQKTNIHRGLAMALVILAYITGCENTKEKLQNASSVGLLVDATGQTFQENIKGVLRILCHCARNVTSNMIAIRS